MIAALGPDNQHATDHVEWVTVLATNVEVKNKGIIYLRTVVERK
jgi:hypothetical protein